MAFFAALRKRSVMVPNLYHFHHGRVFLPGSGNVVFEPLNALPAVASVGIQQQKFLNPVAAPQVYQGQTARISGIGGVIVGQFWRTPLNVPDTMNGSQ
jgi:hypothetical protein